jgi:hypothetical protein
MELRNKEELRSEILQYWLRSAWVYPFQGPDERTYRDRTSAPTCA